MIYDRYAEVYDASGQVHFSLRMIAYLTDLLPRLGWRGESALDLACGTGTLALAYAQWGLRAYGVDGSAAMLRQAEAKALALGLSARFGRQDMRSFAVPEPVDLISCGYDSLNYLLEPGDVLSTFRRVAAELRPGGLFAFDVNTAWMYENVHDGTHFAEGEGLAVAVQGTYDRETRLAVAKLTGFVQREAVWERFDETHYQRAHTDAELAAALRVAGLTEVARYHCFAFDPPRADTARVMWVARAPG
ncbi:MAG: class I SAM-dependent DNA methyltransferase [Chloroflexota bacterium]